MKLAPILILLASSWGCAHKHSPTIPPEALLDPALRDQPLPEGSVWAGRMLSVVPRVRNAVQFSDAIGSYPEEEQLQSQLQDGGPKVRLHALLVLMIARAPQSAQQQWDTWNELRDDLSDISDLKNHAALAEDFESRNLIKTLERYEPDLTAGGADAQWAIRMIGVAVRIDLLDRVAS
jgi:hypothetical protein